MTRSQMAAFLRKIAAGAYSDDEWAAVMPVHYQDIPTENARRRAVTMCLGYTDDLPEMKRQLLLEMADSLEQAPDPCEFYFHSLPVGILHELPPLGGESEIGYEPYRSAGHFELQGVLRGGGTAICEYMQEGRRRAFAVRACPTYGRLTVVLEAAPA